MVVACIFSPMYIKVYHCCLIEARQ
uniref:Uncharacterized protein n=1 Tax=Anguilla anguilla TaxID=7936 RepID=A0A0E9TSQ6_ANGAN